jgi:hypothetical protein
MPRWLIYLLAKVSVRPCNSSESRRVDSRNAAPALPFTFTFVNAIFFFRGRFRFCCCCYISSVAIYHDALHVQSSMIHVSSGSVSSTIRSHTPGPGSMSASVSASSIIQPCSAPSLSASAYAHSQISDSVHQVLHKHILQFPSSNTFKLRSFIRLFSLIYLSRYWIFISNHPVRLHRSLYLRIRFP